MSDHDSCRQKVCVICVKKATRHKKLSETDGKLIKEYANNTYNITDPDYPCSLCTNCYVLLHKKKNNADDINLPIKEFTPDRRQLLRSSESCSCSISEIAKANFFLSFRDKERETQTVGHNSK